jgi:predicted NBD/HSP70 family sugar kinase
VTPDAPSSSTIGDPLGRGFAVPGVRRHNLGTLLEHLHLHGPASRSVLGAASGLSRSTILDLVQDLVAMELVREEGLSSSTGPGRPSPIVHVRPEGAVVVAVELAVEDVAVATIGLGGHVFDQVRVGLAARDQSAVDTARTVVRLAEGLMKNQSAGRAVAGVGVAMPGLTRRRDGFVHLAPNLGWKDVPFGELLADAFGLPRARVLVANEADLGALGEHRRGVGRGRQNLVFVSGGVGIGAGVILGGRPMLGAAGYAGEAGHMVVNPAGRPCTCGSTGCWETEAGGSALVRASGRRAPGGPGEIRAIEQRLADGDRDASVAVQETGRWLGLGISNLVNLLNPEVVVLGGIYQSLFPHLERPVAEAMREHVLDELSELVTVLPSILGTSAQLHGAAELCLAGLLRDPTSQVPLAAPSGRRR